MSVAFDLLIATLFLPGIGLLIALPVRRLLGHPTRLRDAAVPLDHAFAIGLCATLIIVMLAGKVPAALLLAAAALALCAIPMRWFRNDLHPSLLINLAVALLVVSLLAGALTVPLVEWDARSIWYHHAKVIYYFGADWSYLASIPFTHADYPKLLPATASTIAGVFGDWSDTHTKYAGFLLSLPLLLAMLRLSAAASVALTIAWAQSIYGISNGYMDALVALATATLAAILAERLVHLPESRSNETDYAASAMLIAAMLLSMKNEGLFCAAALLGSLLFFLPAIRDRLPRIRTLALLAGGALLPYVIWSWIKAAYSIHGDLLAGGVGPALIRVSNRLVDIDALRAIGEALFVRSGLIAVWAAIVVLAILTYSRRNTRKHAAAYLLLCSLSYTGILSMVYLSTPMDLQWHLNTSASRVVLTPLFLAFLSVAYLLVPASFKPGIRGSTPGDASNAQ